MVDTLGLILAVWVHAADQQDRSAAREFVFRAGPLSPQLKVVWADLGYESGPLKKLMKKVWHADLEIKKHAWQGSQRVLCAKDQEPPPAVEKPKGFQVLPKRWVVERTFAWLNLHRRHSKDYEVLTEQSEFFIRVSMTRNMLRRLAQ